MLLNGIRLTDYSASGDGAQFELSGTTVQEVAALNGQLLTVTDDAGEEVEAFVGYSIDYIKVEEEIIRMRAVKSMDDTTASAIEQLSQKVEAASGKADAAKQKAEESATKADTAASTAADAKTKAEEAKTAASTAGTAATEAKDAAQTAQNTADEAKSIAEQAGTDQQVKAASAMFVNAQPLSNTQLTDVRDLIEDFVQGAEYEQGWVRRYEGKYYRMAQKITSTTSQTYLPGTGTESLYTLIDLATDGIRVWHAPTDATNSFALGEECHYPDAEGPVYVSGRNGNTSEPGTDEWWTIKED